ncbi:hypothetical protein Tco_0145987 [Tanacetum coccineum]
MQGTSSDLLSAMEKARNSHMRVFLEGRTTGCDKGGEASRSHLVLKGVMEVACKLLGECCLVKLDIVLTLEEFSCKIFLHKETEELGKLKEVIYSNSKIIQVIKTYWELGHEHKFITEIVARRANECIVSITEPDYKNLNKNDIEDMYLLIMNGKINNNDVKYGYIQKDLTNEEVEYLKLFEEEIEVSQSDEKMGDVHEWKTTWTTKRTP